MVGTTLPTSIFTFGHSTGLDMLSTRLPTWVLTIHDIVARVVFVWTTDSEWVSTVTASTPAYLSAAGHLAVTDLLTRHLSRVLKAIQDYQMSAIRHQPLHFFSTFEA